jgi:hypothetical protein
MMTVLAIVALLVVIVVIVYNLFFLTPFICIDQVQIYHLPLVDRNVGFQMVFTGINYNVLDVQLQSAFFQISVGMSIVICLICCS